MLEVILKVYLTKEKEEETSMMWPSQNFLLYNGTIIKIKVNEWINNLKKYILCQYLPFEDTYNMYQW